MRNQRSFSPEFKRQVVEELLSGESRPAQICRRYNIYSSVLYHLKKQYSRGKLNNEPTEEGALIPCVGRAPASSIALTKVCSMPQGNT